MALIKYTYPREMDNLRNIVKKQMGQVAKWIDRISGGLITPTHVTLASLFLHIPIFLAIVGEYYLLAALMVIVFGLLDSVDGELARLQSRATKSGMLLDASTDRMKESLIFMALAYRFALNEEPLAVLGAVAAITGSMAVSYIKAKGETAMKDSKLDAQDINRTFQAGLMRYEVRMALLVVGLIFTSILQPIVWSIAVLAWLTAFYRLIVISRKIVE